MNINQTTYALTLTDRSRSLPQTMLLYGLSYVPTIQWELNWRRYSINSPLTNVGSISGDNDQAMDDEWSW